jgi:hypothetical protein
MFPDRKAGNSGMISANRAGESTATRWLAILWLVWFGLLGFAPSASGTPVKVTTTGIVAGSTGAISSVFALKKVDVDGQAFQSEVEFDTAGFTAFASIDGQFDYRGNPGSTVTQKLTINGITNVVVLDGQNVNINFFNMCVTNICSTHYDYESVTSGLLSIQTFFSPELPNFALDQNFSGPIIPSTEPNSYNGLVSMVVYANGVSVGGFRADGVTSFAYSSSPQPSQNLVVLDPFLLSGLKDYRNIDLPTLLPADFSSLSSSIAFGLCADGVSAAIAIFKTNTNTDVTFTTTDGTSLLPYDPAFLTKSPEGGSATLTIRNCSTRYPVAVAV